MPPCNSTVMPVHAMNKMSNLSFTGSLQQISFVRWYIVGGGGVSMSCCRGPSFVN